MSYRDSEDNNIMKSFFRGDIKIDDQGPRSKLVEIGHGIGIGHMDGSYSKYIRQLSAQSKEGNGIIYLGKAINEEKGTMSIVSPTEKFDTGNIPKLLIMFHNIINGIMLKVEWKNMDDNDNDNDNNNNNVILEQYYQIPSPHSMRYDWWDTYSAYFIGPEHLEEGDYKVKITSDENTRSKQIKGLSATIKFSVGKD